MSQSSAMRQSVEYLHSSLNKNTIKKNHPKKQSSTFCREAGIYSLVACDSDFLLHDLTERNAPEKPKSIIRWSKQSSKGIEHPLSIPNKRTIFSEYNDILSFQDGTVYSSGPQFLSSRMQQTHVSNWTLVLSFNSLNPTLTEGRKGWFHHFFARTSSSRV